LQTDRGRIEDGQLQTVAGQYLERTLSHLARNALLEPATA
jgi:hypothetical protein